MLDALEALRDSLAPHYDIERQIGAGGMARVFLAVEQHPHRRVAIKVIAPELSNRLLRERFIREVDLSSKLSHPHIVPIFSAGEAAGLFYYVMPYVEGESLRQRLLRERRLPLEAALHITRDVADALAFAHAQGIIHRDIKPENILLSGDHAIVADFGIARAISAAGALTITQTGQSIGSPGYMSPEQALGSGDLDARTDIYSLGCVLFEALAGEPPVPSLAERLIHNWGALESCDALRGEEGGVARAVKHAISKALAPLPDDRFATAAGFAAALGGSAHRTSVPTRGIFAGRRGRRIALVGAALVVAGGRFRGRGSAATDGTVLRALAPVAGPLAQPLDAVEALRQRVMAALATLFDSRLNRWATTASQPPNFQAYQEFIAGLDRFVQFDMRGAIAHFERASAVDTAFRLPLIFAANAHMNVGEFAAADAIGHALERHAGQLAPLDRSYLAWVLATCRGDGGEALRASRAMASLAPASEALYLVAEDAMALNRPREAVDALVALGPDRGFTRGWWVYWYDLTSALHLVGDHRRELQAALEGLRRFPDNPQILATQVRALAALGRVEEMRRGVAASLNLPPMEGWAAADVLLLAAIELRAHGHPAAADTLLAQARDWLAARPPAEAASEAHRVRVALVAYTAGRLADAQREFERLAARGGPGRSGSVGGAAVMGDAWDQMDYLGYVGAVAARQGNRDQALRVAQTLERVTRPYLFGRPTVWRARIAALLGERDGPVALLPEAFANGYPH